MTRGFFPAPCLHGGAVAQLGERVNGIDEVRGSNPLSSTIFVGRRNLAVQLDLLGVPTWYAAVVEHGYGVVPHGSAGQYGDLLDYVLDEGPKLRGLTDIRELARVLGVCCGGFGYLNAICPLP